MAEQWQYFAQRILDGTWLDRVGAQMTSVTMTWDLATDQFQGTITPQDRDRTASDGRPLFDEWSTAIYAVESGIIRWGGLLIDSEFTGPGWVLGAVGFRGYPNGNMYNGAVWTQNAIDPLDVVRYIWSYLQTQPGGNLGLVADTTASTARVGAATYVTAPGNQSLTQIATAANLTLAQIQALNSTANRSANGYTYQSLPATGNVPAGVPVITALSPYTLAWYNGTDCGQELSNLAQSAPFGMSESHAWADAGQNTVSHRLVLGYPRIGTRQQNLRFVEGENITALVDVSRNGVDYANELLGIGAGTGSAAVRTTVGSPDPYRLRRCGSVVNQMITDAGQLSSLAQRMLTTLQAPLAGQIGSCTWLNHPNAPLGSFAQGDDVLISVKNGWLAGQDIWHRITSYTYNPATMTGTLTMARSDSFTYEPSATTVTA
jgi:hypothetical protein